MRQHDSAKQDERQRTGTLAAAPQAEIEGGCDSDRRGEFHQSDAREQDGNGREFNRVVGDDADCPAYHQAAGCSEKTANDGIGNEADCTAGARKPEGEQQDAGEDRGKAHDDADRRKEIFGYAVGG